VSSSPGDRVDPRPGDQSYAGTRYYRLGFGIASPVGVLFWIGAGIMIAALVPRMRAERRARKAAAAAEAAFRKPFDEVGRLSAAADAVLAPRVHDPPSIPLE